MRSVIIALALVAGIGLVGSQARAAECSGPAFQQVRDSILQGCPCTNHGQHVSCVAHAVKQAVADGDLDVTCKGKVVRCGARSTCGHKAGFVTCSICDPGTCTNGLCDDGVTACDELTPCAPVLRRCSTKSDASKCKVPEGSPGATVVVGGGSCCAASCVVE